MSGLGRDTDFYKPSLATSIRDEDKKKLGAKLKTTILTKESMLNIFNLVSDRLKKTLTNAEKRFILNHIMRFDFSRFTAYSLPMIKTHLITYFVAQLSSDSGVTVDTHEMQKILIGGVDTSKDVTTAHHTIFNKQKGMPLSDSTYHQLYEPSSLDGSSFSYSKFESREMEKIAEEVAKPDTSIPDPIYKRVNILLDSKNRNRSLPTSYNSFSWVFSITPESKDGSVACVANDVNRITAIGVNEFRIPYNSSADNLYKTITMRIIEFDSLATIGTENRRYHIQFAAEQEGRTILLKNYREDDNRFTFPKPVQILSTITLDFGAPLTPVIFDTDFFNVTIVPFDSSSSYILFSTAPLISDGETLYFSNYSTANPTQDAPIITAINSTTGFLATIIDSLTVSIAIDTTSVTLPTAMTECFIGSRRFLINMKLEYIPK